MADTNPTLRRRQLATQLREMRLGAGMTIDEVAQQLMVSTAKISRLETGQRGASLRDVRDLCNLYGTTDPTEVETLLTAAREARQPGLRAEFADLGQDAVYLYFALESEVTSIVDFQTSHVPGLLQTDDYARALIRGVLPHITHDVLDNRVEVRMKRQQRLVGENPPRYWAVIDEALLHRRVGGVDVMRRQLDHLIEMAELPHVTIQMIPFDVGPYMGLNSAFVLLQNSDLKIVFLEGLTSVDYIEKQTELQIYQEAVEHLRAVALDPQASITRIAELRDKYGIEGSDKKR
ncbi:helix-turn-helix domain-containing protein [Planotetraspora kaengkrachanensis]|uniref:Transcriptional regulator n=1 Tax=Planotetraspora kaengkrachanensis TaxID=575193 RepID=A0A8J3PVM4_9ACTN|nr:helix-turn-helix transcriptional regulator [Planotetraspora kaengkrachanensis]GIG81902.1 transcriptional regulator [Planotetraspora kaengkrachanensis]